MSGYITRYDTVTLGEPGVLITPHHPEPALPGVVYVHGSSDDALYPIRDNGMITGLMLRLAARAHRAISGYFAVKFTWANPANQAAITHAADVLMGVGVRVVLVAGSMGAAAALVWAAHHRDRVACVVAHLPVCDIDDIHAAYRWGVAPAIDAAYARRLAFAALARMQGLLRLAVVTGLPSFARLAVFTRLARLATVTGLARLAVVTRLARIAAFAR